MNRAADQAGRYAGIEVSAFLEHSRPAHAQAARAREYAGE